MLYELQLEGRKIRVSGRIVAENTRIVCLIGWEEGKCCLSYNNSGGRSVIVQEMLYFVQDMCLSHTLLFQ
ncbi:hypothetical protein PBOR_25640 [Paenibacillus borealis]|uniref:Uncharacterized protein n=1 Tax=Paenibacillus borealis TaxID=160799 RepID=A0A089LEP6_PAEBO|nr:hypothetical protein PBOR_25640 [Paenibacillus borealis]